MTIEFLEHIQKYQETIDEINRAKYIGMDTTNGKRLIIQASSKYTLIDHNFNIVAQTGDMWSESRIKLIEEYMLSSRKSGNSKITDIRVFNDPNEANDWLQSNTPKPRQWFLDTTQEGKLQEWLETTDLKSYKVTFESNGIGEIIKVIADTGEVLDLTDVSTW
jgi:hypothetical protein